MHRLDCDNCVGINNVLMVIKFYLWFENELVTFCELSMEISILFQS